MSSSLKPLFVRQRWMRMSMVLGALWMVAGCGTVKVLEPAQAAAIKNVGIISLLPTSLVYQKTGVTVFNNERAEKPVQSAFNDAARAGAESALRGQRLNVRQLDVNVAEVKELFKPGAIVFSWPPEKAKQFMVQLARQQGLDAIVTVHEVFDPDNGFAGVRYFLRGGLDSITRHGIRADTEVSLYDAKGESLVSRSTGLGALYMVDRPDGKPWVYRLEDNLDAATHAQVLSSMKKVIETKTFGQVQALGF
jgi:hypothetical protein